MPDIWFPYLGIEIDHLDKVAFTIFGIDIAWYGVLITCGMLLGLLLARIIAKKSGQDPDTYLDFLIYAMIFGLIGARLYYVIFSWDQYKDNLMKVFDLRGGGLAIYGVIIGAVATAIVFCKAKKISFLQLWDTIAPCLALGQAIGRWGNFCNQECFGTYTDSLFAMRLNVETAAYTTPELLMDSVSKGGVRYIQVHPMFLYESFWCLMLVALMLFLWKKRKFKGEIVFTYMIGYGIGRAWIESLRTDQLLLWNTNFPVSIIVSILLAIAGTILMIVFARKACIEKARAALTTNEYAPEIAGEKIISDIAAPSTTAGAADESTAAGETDETSADDEVVTADDSESSADQDAADGADFAKDAASGEEDSMRQDDAADSEDQTASEKPKKPITDEDLWG
ncbi:MAG: prolipoprotein diacylglyceryl transferase [Firmicutes bacterium]|nr:prolipoprotein diacylglyceryl transferase [Bacillota bacterium]